MLITSAFLQAFSECEEMYTIKARDKQPSNIACLGHFLLKVPWEDMLAPYNSSEEKLAILTDVVNYGINTIMPERSMKVHAADRPWITDQLKRLIAKRQKAFTSGNKSLYAVLGTKLTTKESVAVKPITATKCVTFKTTSLASGGRKLSNCAAMAGFLVRIFVQFLMKTLAIATKN